MKRALFVLMLLPLLAMAQVPTEGLVAYYPFSGNANDESGNAYHGTVCGATLSTDRFGQMQHAYRFDGVSSYIFIGDILDSVFCAPVASFTISGWASCHKTNPGGNDPNSIVISKASGWPNYQQWVVGQSKTLKHFGQVTFTNDCANTLYTCSDTLIKDDQWYHFALVFNGFASGYTRIRFYIDGNLMSTTTLLGTNGITSPNTSQPILIGGGFLPGSYNNMFCGKIDDIRIYDRALGAADVFALSREQLPTPMPVRQPIAYLPFDGNAKDACGYNDGVVNGALLTTDRFGKPASAYSFNGIDAYISLGDVLDTVFCAPVAKYTITGWAVCTHTNPGGNDPNSDPLTKASGYPGFQEWAVAQSKALKHFGQVTYTADMKNTLWATSDALTPDRQWYQFALVFDGSAQGMSRVRFYIDGKLCTSLTLLGLNGTTSPNTGQPIIIGGGFSPTTLYSPTYPYYVSTGKFNNMFAGKIDDIRIYDAALDDSEIKQLYAQEAPSAPSVLSDLVAYYPFNGNANDESGNGFNGQVFNATLVADRGGRPASAYSFNGTSSYIKIGDVLNDVFCTQPATFTVTGWASSRITSAGGNTYPNNVIVGKTSGYAGEMQWEAGQSQVLGNYGGVYTTSDARNQIYMKSTTLIPQNEWYHFAMVFDGQNSDTTRLLYFVNGKQVARTPIRVGTVGTTTQVTTQPILIGGAFKGTAYNNMFNGLIDDIRIYSRALSSDEIRQQYAGDVSVDSSKNAWTVQLVASADSMSDAENYFGCIPNATDGLDTTLDAPKPPKPAGEYVRVSFPHPEYGTSLGSVLGSDYRRLQPLADRMLTWQFEVATTLKNREVTLTFPGAGRLPAGWGVFLKDCSSGVRKNLRSSAFKHVFNAGTSGICSFEISVGDSTPPQLSILKPTAGEILRAGKPYTIQWSAVDGSGVDSVKVYVSTDSGKTYQKLAVLGGSLRQYVWSVPAQKLSRKNFLKIVAADSAGNTGTKTHDAPFIIAGDSLTVTFAAGWNLVGPMLAASDSTVSKIFGTAIANPFFIFDYSQAGGYVPATSISCGKGYWLGLYQPVTIDMKGTPMTQAQTVGLIPGFNLISNPFAVAVPRDSLKFTYNGIVASYTNALTAGWIAAGINGYNKNMNTYSSVDILQPWTGYWLGTLKSGVSMIIEPALASAQLGKTAAAQKAAASNWVLRIAAASPGGVDQALACGFNPNATDGFDPAYDEPKAPLPPETGSSISGKPVQLFFNHPEWSTIVGSRFNTDIRSVKAVQEWTFTVEPAESSVVTLTWNTDGISGSFQLTDNATGTRILMNNVKSYSFTAQETRTFTILAAVTDVETDLDIPREFCLDQNYPNPFNPSTTIRYHVAQPSVISIRVYNLLGNEVATLVNEYKNPGVYLTTWNGAGHASGIYFYRMTVSGSSKFTQARKLLLVK